MFLRRHRVILKYVNAVRAEHFLPPIKSLPRGERRYLNGCVLAVALKDLDPEVQVRSNTLTVWGHDYSHPQRVRDFIIAFDQGRYPDLVA